MPKAPRTADVARRLVDAYVTSLRQHLPTYCIRQLDKLPGAQEHQLTRLRQSYPGAPTELLYFLRRLNGTCWESLVAPPGSVPPPVPNAAAGASSSATVSNTKNNAPAAAAGAAASMPAAEFTKAAAAPSATASASKSSAKATTAAASIASEAAAFIKSHIAKKVTGGGGVAQRPRRLPHYVALPILGSTYTTCPYYLKSVEQMLLAEQQFPPPSANLPDEGDSWTPPPPPPSAAPITANTAAEQSSAGAAKDGGLSDTAASTAAGVQLNKNTIASVFAGCKIIYGVPPCTPEGKAAGEAAPASVDIATAASPSTSAGATTAEASGDGRVVFVDPRIDIHANFYHWLVFADSVQPHVREKVPTIPDADPAKIAAAAAVAAAASTGGPFQPEAMSNVTLADTAVAATTPVKVFAPSRLYIDFKPVELQGGVQGQVIQFVHGQPSSFTVVANDFGSYLKYIMSEEYEFTEELEDDEDDEEDEEDDDAIKSKSASSGGEKSKASAAASSPAAPKS